MRRVLASFVFLMMSWTFAVPLLLGATGASVPACCRRDGEHHCSAGVSADAGNELPSARSTSPKCPHCSQIAPASIAGVPQPSGKGLIGASGGRLAREAFALPPALLGGFSNSQRGPPAIL